MIINSIIIERGELNLQNFKNIKRGANPHSLAPFSSNPTPNADRLAHKRRCKYNTSRGICSRRWTEGIVITTGVVVSNFSQSLYVKYEHFEVHFFSLRIFFHRYDIHMQEKLEKWPESSPFLLYIFRPINFLAWFIFYGNSR